MLLQAFTTSEEPMPSSNKNQVTLTIKVSKDVEAEMKELCKFFAGHQISGTFQMHELKAKIFEHGLKWARKRKKGLENKHTA